MSKPTTQSLSSSWSTQTSFAALGVESGEETDDDYLQEDDTTPELESSEPVRPTKSAIKKAKALARSERRKQEKLERQAARARSSQATPVEDLLSSSVDSLPPLAKASSTSSLSVPVSVTAPTPASAAPVQSPTPDTTNSPTRPAPVTKQLPSPPTNAVPKPPVTNGNVQTEKIKPVESVKSTPAPVASPAPPVAKPTPPPKVAISEKKPVELSAVKPPTPNTSPITKSGQNGPSTLPVSQPPSEDPAQAEKTKKMQNALTRTIWTLIMIGGFLGLLAMGHAYMIVLVMLCQTLVYREVTSLFSLTRKGGNGTSTGRDPWSKTLNWYFFAATNYFLYGESIIHYFKHIVFSDAQLTVFAANHRMISFCLYTLGFVGFVMSLQRGHLKQQFGLFCWVHMTLMLIVVSSHFIVNNILEGMIWFWVPASLVICNDVFAYIWGITIGRTPLIKLSPKKTVEGFVGAFFSTVIFAIFWGTFFMRFDYMICPVRELGVSAFDGATQCKPNLVFVWRDWEIPAPARVFLSTLLGKAVTSIPYAPYQIHLFFMACFASLVAPFGGFFASGFKRAFNIKDFGHSIPGHGGMTDRMDCQFLMGVFTYVYYSNLIRESHVTVGAVLQTIVSGLTLPEQLELIADLKRYLEGQGISVPV